MKILADSTLPGIKKAFPPPFELTLYHNEKIPALLSGQSILICRSTLKVGEELLQGHSLRHIATASSGIDHIDSDYLRTQAIELIDAKGSNASAVADYVLACLAFLHKYKNFHGKKAAVIGVGAVGSQVAKRLQAIGLTVVCYDPLRSQYDSQFQSCSFDAIAECDLLCIHANLHNHLPYPSKNLIDKKLLQQLKPGTTLINTSRGGIVNEEDLLQVNHLTYCTDVYNNEPIISKAIINYATLCTPHIAGHSVEAKYAAVEQISRRLHAHYHLEPPPSKTISPLPIRRACTLRKGENWQDSILALYNPYKETQALKSAQDIKSRFQNLRAGHNYRRDFGLA